MPTKIIFSEDASKPLNKIAKTGWTVKSKTALNLSFRISILFRSKITGCEPMKRFKIPSVLAIILVLLISFGNIIGTEQATGKTETVKLNRWLRAGPLELPFPAFANDGPAKFDLKKLLSFEPVSLKDWWPHEGENLPWSQTPPRKWKLLTGAPVNLNPFKTNNQPAIVYLAAYLNAGRWLKARLELRSLHPFAVYLDGKLLDKKTASRAAAAGSKAVNPAEISKTVKLETGKHLLIVKALFDPRNSGRWSIDGSLKVEQKFGRNVLRVSGNPEQIMNIHTLMDGPKVAGVSISPDGRLAAVTIRQSMPPSDKSESWIELRRIRDAGLLQTYRGGLKFSGVRWAPVGRKFSYITTRKDKSKLWLVDLDRGTTTLLAENLKNFHSHRWAPDGSFIIYSLTEKPKKDDRGVKRLRSLRDRWPWWRNRTFLYKITVPGGVKYRLTAGKLTTNLEGISPGGQYLLFTRETEDYTRRPYGITHLFRLNLKTMKLDTVWSGGWFDSAVWSPDGAALLLKGGPSMFGETGKNLPKSLIPNEYDSQLYQLDLRNKKVTPLTRNFNPDVISASWRKNGDIFLTAIDGEYRRLFRYSGKNKEFRKLSTGVDVIGAISFAKHAPLAAYTGSSAAAPQKAYAINLRTGKHWLLSYPQTAEDKFVKLSKVESWSFRNRRGAEIHGRIYYPPGFDAGKKYPFIVYYYGGVNTTVRSFGGRYPKNLFAAQGYVVYVLQPSGATGYGQAFSALHVNDWGKIVADEIIDGVKQFLAAHPFVDARRVGCIGASYGGFMTELLVTKTNIFAAAISHAGISDISSYWGSGYWGYLYNAVSAANSFPWNRPDIYVKQSPLYNVENVTTPILLLHGTADTNVPPGESNQFFTALKLTGKTVEYVRIADQNHHIVNYHKRIIWQKTILAWFDRWLKDQPEWWNDLYPGKN